MSATPRRPDVVLPTMPSRRGAPLRILQATLSAVLVVGCGTEPAAGPEGVPVLEHQSVLGMTFADLDGDGFDDMVFVGASRAAEGTSAVYVVYGRSERPATDSLLTPDATLRTNITRGPYSHFVAEAGDFDGDGHQDVLLLLRSGQAIELGEDEPLYVGVLFGSEERLPAEASIEGATLTIAVDAPGVNAWTIEPSVLGDANGDGFDDFAIHFGETDTAWYFAGHAAPWPETLTPTVAASGERLSGVGDVDGDGQDDLLSFGGAWEWRVHFGPVELDPERLGAGERLFNEGRGCYFHGAGIDLNGDERTDFVFRCGQGSDDNLRVVYSQGRGMLATPGPGSPAALPCGTQCGVVSAGDSNGDGVDELLLGLDQVGCEGPVGPCPGRVERFLSRDGAPALTAPAEVWSGRTEPHNEGIGRFVRQDGDFDGDGYADALLGAASMPSTLVFGAP